MERKDFEEYVGVDVDIFVVRVFQSAVQFAVCRVVEVKTHDDADTIEALVMAQNLFDGMDIIRSIGSINSSYILIIHVSSVNC